MALSLLFAAALGAQARPPPSAGPRESFIICPGHPRCPRTMTEPSEGEGRLPATRGFTLHPPARARAAPARPRPRADAGGTRDRIVYFSVNATALDAQAHVVLDALADWLAANPSRSASIEGHADARGSRDRNVLLAGRRAAAVRAYLVARGVTASRLTAFSFGEERPALYDSGEPVWMMNRRVEIRIR